MNAEVTRPVGQPRAWRLRRWPHDPRVAHLVFLDHLNVPDPLEVATATERARAGGAVAVRTSALFSRAAEVVLAAGYHPIDTLALLHRPLGTASRPVVPVDHRLPPTQPLRPWQMAQAVDIDVAAFGSTWANDLESLRDIRRATPAHRARVARHAGPIAGFSIAGAAGSNGYLQRLAVAPRARRAGLATALVVDALAWMAARRLGGVLVNTGTANTAALALYDRLGFLRLDEQLIIAEHRFG